ncbi:sulfatase-like hydrolase/transferase [Halobacteriales archaeon Cl-PHB]
MTRNVALVVLDTVRKDYFDDNAPRIRRRSDASFEQCRAASSWSTPSHTSMFTGELPSDHGVHAESFDAGFDFSQFAGRTVMNDLDGWRTVGLSANSYINSHFGVDALFDAFHDFSIGSHTAESLFTEGKTVDEYMKRTDEPSALKRYLGFLGESLGHDHPAKSVANGVWAKVGPRAKHWPVPGLVDDGAGVITDRAVEAASEGTEPTFMFLNYMDAHTPLRNLVQHDRRRHDVPNSWSSTKIDKWELNKDGAATESYTHNYREVYAASIEYLDRTVDDLVERLQAATDRETTVVVTADHGHNLGYDGENDMFHHTSSMSEGIMHVPLEIINPPEGFPETESRLFSHLDLRDLLVGLATDDADYADLLRERVPAETIGLLGGENATWGREFDDAEMAWWNRMIRCVYADGTKRQWNSVGDAFEYGLDPDRPARQELVDTDVSVPQADRRLFETPLSEFKEAAAAETQDTEFDDEVADHLEQLGYL